MVLSRTQVRVFSLPIVAKVITGGKESASVKLTGSGILKHMVIVKADTVYLLSIFVLCYT